VSAGEPALKIQVGLAVNPKKYVYIVRSSDDELLKYLEEGEYCNVLCSRQMGALLELMWVDLEREHARRPRLLRRVKAEPPPAVAFGQP
jgi:hypothetical protein